MYTEHPGRGTRAQPGDVPPPRLRPAVNGDALADPEGRRIPPRRRGAAGGPPGDGLPRRAAGPDPRRRRPPAGERPRIAARLAADGGRIPRVRGAGRRVPPAGGGRVRPHRRGAPRRAAPGGALRRPLRLLLPGARLPRVPRRAGGPPARRDLSRHGGGQAPSGGLLHRRLSAGAAQPPLPAGHAQRAGHLELRRDRLPLPRRCGGPGALRPGGPRLRLPHPGRRAALADQVPPGHGRPPRPAGLQGHPGARPGPGRLRARPVRLRPHGDGHPGLHRDGAQPGQQGRPPRSGRAERDLPRELACPGSSCPPVWPAPGRSAPAAWCCRGRPTRSRRRWGGSSRRAPAFAGWPLLVLADDLAIAGSSERFLWATFTRFAPAADLYPAGDTEARRHHLAYRAPIRSTPG